MTADAADRPSSHVEHRRAQPDGATPGALTLLIALATAVLIAGFTGASAVAAVAAFVVAVVVLAIAGGWVVAARTTVGDLRAPSHVIEAGRSDPWTLHVRRPVLASSVRIAVEPLSDTGQRPLGAATLHHIPRGRGTVTVPVAAARPGTKSAAGITLVVTDPLGLTCWRRTATMVIEPLTVAAPEAWPPAPSSAAAAGDDIDDQALTPWSPRRRRGHGEIDDLRAFAVGDQASHIAWGPSLRSGTLLVREQSAADGRTWMVDAGAPPSTSSEAERQAGRIRAALLDRLRTSARAVALRQHDATVTTFDTAQAIDEWSASYVDAWATDDPQPTRWTQLQVRLTRPDTVGEVSRRSRALAAAATAIALWALAESFGASLAARTAIVAALAVAVLVNGPPPQRAPYRVACGIAAAAVVFAMLGAPRATGLADMLRGILPQLLVSLMVLQVFETTDRRACRVTVALSAASIAYAAGLSIDGALAATCALWAAVFVAAMRDLAGPAGHGQAGRRTRRWYAAPVIDRLIAIGTAGVAAAIAVGVLQFVAVPQGPARLTLPTFVSENAPPAAGRLTRPDGSPTANGAQRSPQRAPDGAVGGYPGFTNAMDTSSRGPLGDDIVLRVRAPQADFWRGQTFDLFDGQVWTSSTPEAVTGFRDGDNTVIEGGLYDQRDFVIAPTTAMVQTFFVDVDLPNLVFAAPDPTGLTIDAAIAQRLDGTILTDRVLPAGSIYTVTSQRVAVTADLLRSLGRPEDLPAEWRQLFEFQPFLQVPESTGAATIQLAAALDRGSPSTYDTILRIQDWLGANTRYDLDAPVPADGENAVDHFLFDSQLGFCEQIASAMAIMLRTLGVPTRVATGYVPGDRDEFAGVWVSRASDAHAWVEVWFPGVGWQPFDPTASVPLAGEDPQRSIGAELVQRASTLVSDRATDLGVLALAGFGGFGVWHGGAALLRHRRRGPWGRLQDRFAEAAMRRGADEHADNRALATAWHDHQSASLAAEIADALDAHAFAPDGTDSNPRHLRRHLAALRTDR